MTKLQRDLKRHPVRTDVDDADHKALVRLAQDTDLPIAWHTRRAIQAYLREDIRQYIQRKMRDADEVTT